MDEAYRLTSSALAPLSVGAIPLALIKVGITEVLLVLFYFVFARRLRGAEDRFAVKNGSLIALSVITVGIVYVLSLYAKVLQVDNVVRGLYAVCCCLLLLLFQFGLFEKGNVEKKNEQIRRMLALEHEQHRLFKEKYRGDHHEVPRLKAPDRGAAGDDGRGAAGGTAARDRKAGNDLRLVRQDGERAAGHRSDGKEFAVRAVRDPAVLFGGRGGAFLYVGRGHLFSLRQRAG